MRARAATEEAKAQAAMQTRLAEELKTALVTAERAFITERTSLEESLGHERDLRKAESEAHATRVKGWDRKVCHIGPEPRTSRAQTGLLLTRLSLALDP